MRSASNQTRQIRALLQDANIDTADLEVRTHVRRSGPEGIELSTTVRGFTKPMDGDKAVTAQVDAMRATITDTLRATFPDVDLAYGWVSVTTTEER